MVTSLDIWSMRCLVVVAEELHFGRAAKLLNVSQPSLSQTIRRLEEQLGSALLIRSTRKVELTPAGANLVEYAREMLIRMDEAIMSTRNIAGTGPAAGEYISIGAMQPFVLDFLGVVIRRFRQRFPETRIEVNVQLTPQLIMGIERGLYHVAIMREPMLSNNTLNFVPLRFEPFVATMQAGHPLTKKARLKISDFVGHRIFTLRRFEIAGFESIDRKLRAAGAIPVDDIVPSSTHGALPLVSAGLGITFLPSWINAALPADIVTRPVDDLTETLAMGISWYKNNPAPGILPFVEIAKDCATSANSTLKLK